MKKANGILMAALFVVGLAAASDTLAQRARTVSDSQAKSGETTAPTTSAPQTVKAKYEGGVFGYNKKTDGTLNFDDVNRRLLFRDKKSQKEMLSIPYDVIMAASADTQSRRPTAATVAGTVFPYGLPALFIKKKYRYLTLQYNDPDTQASGITSFKMENKEILDSVLLALANKAGLTQRGDIFVRRKDSATTTPASEQPN